MQRIARTLNEQDGVVSRRQLHEHGVSDSELRRFLRRNELRTVHPGVYANHTGTLTWHQRAWAAVLYAWPAALAGHSALRAANGPGTHQLGTGKNSRDDGPIHIAIAESRKVRLQEGVVVHRARALSSRVQWNRSPPPVRIEEAVLDLAAESLSEIDAISVLAGAVSSRQTTARRLIEALAQRKKIARRAFLASVLADVAEGTCSVLEHGYLTRVERPHGLPVAERQAIDLSRGTLYRDALYAEFQQVVELDGRIFHSGAHHRSRDLARDLDAAVDGLSGVRLGWAQVFGSPCDTAAKVGAILQRRGWTGAVTPCPMCRQPASVSDLPDDNEQRRSA